ncbi:hypothetical protein LJC12_01495 [Odoribacter sp. OttesenSCG-928-J03]|nr:hypothetical protein [Odoribacter sp. OttesenSCG-928-J03]MDL2283191.1 hypothetical protein [Odoribacter sp. OttesenSCG-928-G04]
MKKLLLLLFTTLLIYTASAQMLEINGNLVIHNGSTDGASIKIFRNGEKIEEKIMDKKGRFTMRFALDAEYKLVFGKSNYISKIVSINTEVPEEVIEANPNFPPIKLIINLLPLVSGLDLSLFEQSVAILGYNPELDDFSFDYEYAARVKDKIGKLEQDIRRVLEQRGAEVLARERMYEDLVAKGTDNFNKQKWQAAIDNWTKALQVKPEQTALEERIASARSEMKREEKYKQLIQVADQQYNEKLYNEAIITYQEALTLNYNKEYPDKQIRIIREIQNRENALSANYDKKIKEADVFFTSNKYTEAIREYTLALEIKPGETYPKEMINKAQIALADIKQKEEEAAAKKLLEEQRIAALMGQYNQLIAEADLAFKNMNYSLARNRYTEADQLKTGEKYPGERLKEIEKIIHSAKYQQQLSEFNKHIDLAQKSIETKNYAGAKVYYQKAISILPIDKEEIDTKIAEIDRIIEAERIASIEKEYKEHIKKADQSYKEKAYAIAKFYYQKALEVKKDDKYAKGRLSEVEGLIHERTEKEMEF